MLQDICYAELEEKYIDELLVIEKECFAIPWTKTMFLNDLKNEQALYYIAMFNDQVVGYMGVWLVLDEVQVMNIAVKPDFQKRGIGKGLVQTMIAFARERHFLQISLEVRRGNEAAIQLYRTLGFKEVGCRLKYYHDNGEDALLFHKKLR